MPGQAVVGRPDAAWLGNDGFDDVVGDERHVTEEDEESVDIADRRDSLAERSRLAVLPVVDDDVVADVDGLANCGRICTKNRQWRIGGGGLEDMREQRSAVDQRELLRAAEARAGAGREHERPHSMLSISSASAVSERSELPGRKSSAWGRAARIPWVSGA